MAVGTERSIEVVRHSFACQIGDRADTIERKRSHARKLGDGGGFHFNRGRARLAQSPLLLRRLRHVVDRANHAGMRRFYGLNPVLAAIRGDCRRGNHVVFQKSVFT